MKSQVRTQHNAPDEGRATLVVQWAARHLGGLLTSSQGGYWGNTAEAQRLYFTLSHFLIISKNSLSFYSMYVFVSQIIHLLNFFKVTSSHISNAACYIKLRISVTYLACIDPKNYNLYFNLFDNKTLSIFATQAHFIKSKFCQDNTI